MDILTIKNPHFLKVLENEQLVEVAQDIRTFLINKCSISGGHIAPNLGVVELTMALHREFNSPADKIIWDVGHQTYIHKILTGRIRQFDTLRSYNGLSGFPKREESEHDFWETGHSSTSLSAAAGITIARDLNNDTHRVVAVIGDGALTGGMALEALNHIGHEKLNTIVILNDNAMSIAPNIGAIDNMLRKMRANSQYVTAKKKVKTILESTPKIGNKMSSTVEKFRDSVKYFLLPGMFFEELGFKYIGLVDGHDFPNLRESIEQAKKINGPVIVHVVTKKGKGYLPAEQDNTGKWHGIGPYDIQTGVVKGKIKTFPSWSEVASDTVLKLAKVDKRIVAITPAMMVGSKLEKFKKELPKRFFDVGIAEQHASTLAAGLSTAGMKPYLVIYSTFLQRAYDQVLHDIARQNLAVVIGIDRSGLVGEDGDTHQGVFDIAFLRHMPNMTITMPKDENECQNLLFSAFKANGGPIAIRFPRGNVFGVEREKDFTLIPYGSWEILRVGTDITIITFGPTLQLALKAAEKLFAQGVAVKIINARFIKPVDEKILHELMAEEMPILTIEEGILAGGFGSSILEFAEIHGYYNKQIVRKGIPDVFVEHGQVSILLEKLDLTVEGIIKQIMIIVKKKENNEK